MYARSRWAFIRFVMMFWIVGIRGKYSLCEDMYRFIKNHDYDGWFGIHIILRNGVIFRRVCVLERLPRNVCL